MNEHNLYRVEVVLLNCFTKIGKVQLKINKYFEIIFQIILLW